MCKSDQNVDNVKKKTCLGVLERGERGNDNETGLKEGGGIEMSTTVLSIYAIARSLFAFVFIYRYNFLFRHLRILLVCLQIDVEKM